MFHLSNTTKMSAIIALATAAFASSSAYAQASRTWVSGVGDDANPCSRTAPCKTFAGCISKTAAAGEIDALDPGGFGAVTITKSMTIDGGPNAGGILASGTNGVVINAGVNDVVTLRNITINGFQTGFVGIKILNAAEVNIENCVISEFAAAGSGKGVEIANTTNACRVNIKNTIVRGCAGGAVHAHPGSGGAVVNITRSHLNASLFGFRSDDSVVAVLDDCDTSGNLNNGVVVAPASLAARINVNNCVIADNGAFGVASVGAASTVRLSNNTITGNGTGVSAQTSGQIISFGNNRIKGNTADGSVTSTIAQQ